MSPPDLAHSNPSTWSSTFFHLFVTSIEDNRSIGWNDTGYQNHHLENNTWTRNISLIDDVDNFHCSKPLKLRNLPVTATSITLPIKKSVGQKDRSILRFLYFSTGISSSLFGLQASSPWWNTEAHWDNSAWSLIERHKYRATVLLIKMLKGNFIKLWLNI